MQSSPVSEFCLRNLARLTWPGLLTLFLCHYCICYLVLRGLHEYQLTTPLSTFIYYCSVVGSSLGFGDISPNSEAGRLFTGLWQIPVGVVLFGTLLGKVVNSVRGAFTKGRKGMGNFSHLRNHLLLIGWRSQQTEKMLSLLLFDKKRTFGRVLLCAQNELLHHPAPETQGVDFIRVSNFTAPEEQQRIALKHCNRIIVFAPADEQTFTIALSLAENVPESCHMVVYLEDERYATLLSQYCPEIEVVRNLCAEQLTHSAMEPGSSHSITSMLNPMIGDTGCVVYTPMGIKPVQYGAMMHYLKLHHNATLLGVSRSRNGRNLELNPDINTEVVGGMWLHMISNGPLQTGAIDWAQASAIPPFNLR
ncbi:potassium channel family protein [Scandinavium sp. NPDC088450]|uniref:potassium channel family protein n=1 Tax=Scandinavium sp. NPDC088450 TaxID=3364514 RepID=UPI00384FF66F